MSGGGRFTPAWWALWTWALTRPGLLDDEEPPPEAPQSGAWAHYPDGCAIEARPVWDARPGQCDDPAGRGLSPYDPAARRPTWPALLAGQSSGGPAPTDGCRLRGGRCSGTCEPARLRAHAAKGRRLAAETRDPGAAAVLLALADEADAMAGDAGA